MSNNKLLKWGTIIGVIILIGLSLGTIGFMCTKSNAYSEVFAEDVYIEDLAMGGLTKEEAKAKLEQNISNELSKQQIMFTNGNVSKNISLNDLGMTYNIDETIDEAFNAGREEGFFSKIHILKGDADKHQEFNLVRSIDDRKLDEQLDACSETFYVAPVNATLERINRQFITTKEVDGAELDKAATKEKVLQVLNDPDSMNEDIITIEVIMKVLEPECTETSLTEVQTLVSSFSTSYNNSDLNRNENLKVAAEKITRMVLPEETFYLSNQLEPFTEEEGYKNAGTIVNGKIEDSLGGGICQVASTLYNAVLLTDLEIVYRQNHSLAVSYVPLGRDATYNTGTIDFKFKNNSGYPIFIEGYCENNEVIVNIYGHKDLKSDYTIKFESVVTEIIPAPATQYEDDQSLDVGKQIVDVRALDGKRVSLYKLYYKGDELVEKVLVNTSYYRPRAAVIRRGTKGEVIAEIELPSESPSESPLETPAATPSESPLESPSDQPLETPVETPIASPSESPIVPSTTPSDNVVEQPEVVTPSSVPSPALTETPIAESVDENTENDFAVTQE